MAKKSRLQVLWDRFGTRFYLALAVIVMLLALPTVEAGGSYESKLLEHLVMAVMIAAFITFIIDLATHDRLAANVFKAAVGYLLREDLRSELEWIYNQSILCSELIVTVTLKHYPEEGLVKCTTKLERTLENITMRKQFVNVSGGADEWFIQDHPVKVIDASYKKVGTNESLMRMEPVLSDDGVGWSASEVALAPGELLEHTIAIEQWLRDNDVHVLTYRYPIKNPRVTITCDDTLRPRVIFDHRSKYEGDWSTSDNSWHPRVVLLPHQDIRIKWHRRDRLRQVPHGG